MQTVDAEALESDGLSQTFDVSGNFSVGTQTVGIDFLNAASGSTNAVSGGTPGSAGALFLTAASIDGTEISVATFTETTYGSQSFTFTKPVSTLTFTDSDGNILTQQVISSGSLDSYSYQTGLNNNVHQWVDAAGVHNVSTDACAYVTPVSITDNTGTSFATYDFVEADANLTGATTTAGQAATLTVNTAQRGFIKLGSGNYDVSFNAANAWGTIADNTVNVIMGGGADTFSLTGSNGVTDAVVHAGSGSDQMSFIGTNRVTVYGGAGTVTANIDSGHNTFLGGTGAMNITGNGIADAFVFEVGDGLMTVADFSAARGDVLRIDASLISSMQETVQSGGLMISFGAGSADGILLQGVTSVPSHSIYALS